MSRYYFNVHDHMDLPDPEGTDLPDEEAARYEALRRTALVLAGNGKALTQEADWRLDVTDAGGNVVYWIDVSTGASSSR